jgi:hypothetical protein
MTNGSLLNGFTLTKGNSATGGGLFCTSTSSIVLNCSLISNTGWFGGGAFGGTLSNCTVALNSCPMVGANGGGAYRSVLINCLVTSNAVGNDTAGATTGGGAYQSTLVNCTIADNQAIGAGSSGGGVYESTLTTCKVVNNEADFGAGGASYSTLTNCTLYLNYSGYHSGGMLGGVAVNCVLRANRSVGAYGAATVATLKNCSLPGNSAFGSTMNDCITNAPLFVNEANRDLRLKPSSPCINAGNNAYVTASTDLDGLPRIVGDTVDIGAYEFQSSASTISYAWLQQFGLPTDGSADAADTDHDGHNNWQEWMAGTDPTNALSALRLAAPLLTPTNVILTWTSVTNRTYTLEQATNLSGEPAFSVLSSNLIGQPGTTSWADTNAPVSSPRFYQLRVSP